MKVLIACEESQTVCMLSESVGMRLTAATFRIRPAGILKWIKKLNEMEVQ